MSREYWRAAGRAKYGVWHVSVRLRGQCSGPPAGGAISRPNAPIPRRSVERGRVQASAVAQRPVHPAPCADAAGRHPLRAAVDAPAAHPGEDRARLRSAATDISPRARTCNSTGPSSNRFRTFCRNSPRWRCTPSKPAAIASATSPPIIWPGSRPTSSRIRGPGARSSASGRRFIPNSPTCPANSRLP